ncbi:MAG: hypothetical protein AAFN10_00110 [Bacteroidota bacterium]
MFSRLGLKRDKLAFGLSIGVTLWGDFGAILFLFTASQNASLLLA